MKKLAHIITKLELGGAQLNTIYTVNYFAEKNYEVYLITGTGGIVDKSIISSKVKIIEIEELAREINILKDLIAFFRIFWLCRKYKFDIVHTHSSKAGILGRLAAYLAFVPKIIHTVHGWGFTPLQSEIAYKTFVLLERLCAKITDKLVVVADDNCNKGLKNKIGEKTQYITIRSGIDLSLFPYQVYNLPKDDRLKFRERLGLNADDIVITMTACFKLQKNPIEFVKIAKLLIDKKYNNLKFIIVGDGELRKEIEQEIVKNNLRDYFILLGWYKNITEILYASDIFCLTSLWEGLPRAIIEAYAAGLPIVATNVDGNKEIVLHNITGYLYENYQIFEAAHYLELLINDKDRRMEFGRLGNYFINPEFSLNLMLETIEKIY